MEATYKWTDYFTRQRLSCRCELLSRTQTTATIKLLEYGPRGRVPGSIMRVKLESVGIKRAKPVQMDPSWHDWTDI